ncbi:MAG: Trimeric autotransporter adhesin, partial [Collimonas fungivorans]|nr:Trimeric autotransporter adhesin [Collimonas fungivorans]
MNQSYRVVWQASTNTCCAVSEPARKKGKSRSRAVQCHAKSLARIIAVSLGLMGADAALAGTESTEAASPIGQVQSNDPAGGKNKGIKDALAEDETAVAAAVRRRASKINPLTFNTTFPNNPIAFSVDARARTLDGAASGNAARIANDAEDAPAPHPDAKAPGALSDTGQAGSISAGKAGSERQITNLAAGTADTDAVNLGQVKNLVGDGSILRYVKTNGKNDGSDDAVALDEDAMAIGASAKATNTGSTAVGGKAQANGVDSSAFGVDAQANGNGGSLAAGAYSTAQGHFSAALGSGSFTLGDFSTALGAYASALSDGTTALGAYSIASGDQAIAVGSKSEAIGTASIAMGNFAKTENNGAIAIGSQYQEASGEAGFKEAAYAGGRNAVALGAGAFAYATDSLALGPRATVEADNSVALGDHALADRANTVSVGNTRVSDGTAVQTRQIVNVAAGTEENDAVNVGQMNDAIGVVNGSLAGAMMYDDAGKQKMTLAGSSGSVIDNLADGAIAAGSKQAVNGSQLHQVGDSVAQMLGGGAMMGVNGFTGPVFGVQGGSYHNVGDALGALDGALDSLGNRVSSLENGGAPVAE